MAKFELFEPLAISITITSVEQLRAVYAVLANPEIAEEYLIDRSEAARPAEAPEHRHEPADYEQVDEPAADDAVKAEVDSAGVPFDPERHTGTKLKSGLWRMKKGFERPEDEAEPEDDARSDTGQSSAGSETPAQENPASDGPGQNAPTDASPSDEDDEFAAFRNAAAESAAPVQLAAREWSDADLSSLLNQAALKLGGPDEIRNVMGEFVPDGAVVHSRHIPADRREEFAQRIEKLADIEFAG